MMRGLLVAALLAQMAGTDTAVLTEVEWAKLHESVPAEIDGKLYEYSIRKAVEANPGEFCRVEMVLLRDPEHQKLGHVGVDYLSITCGGVARYGTPEDSCPAGSEPIRVTRGDGRVETWCRTPTEEEPKP